MRSLLFLILFCFSLQGSVFSQEYYTVEEFLKSHEEASERVNIAREDIPMKTLELKSLEKDMSKLSREKDDLLMSSLNVDDVFNAAVEKQLAKYKKRDEFETQEEYGDRMLKIDVITDEIKKTVRSELKIDENSQRITTLNKEIEDMKLTRMGLSEKLAELKAVVEELTKKLTEFAPDKIAEIPYLYTLSQYDADGEYFVLSRKGSESLLAKVPRNEARLFKTGFNKVKIYSHIYNSVAVIDSKQYILTKFTLTDSRDNKQYRIVKIGSQIWMAENLAYETKRGSYPYNKDEANVDKYGRLYSWKVLEEACPSGWHVPSDTEWKKFEKAIGLTDAELDLTGERGANSGSVIKSEGGWKNGGNGINKYGLNFLPAGIRNAKGDCASLDELTRIWTSTELDPKSAYSRGLFYYSDKLNRIAQKKEISSSVRCVKN